MSSNDVVLIVLAIVSLFSTILGALGSWALLKTITLGEEVATMKARIVDGDRRFDELKDALNRLHVDMNALRELLQEMKLHLPKRAADGDWRS